jgi:3'-phosphoadenosine 5'-phosphosulfate sulfotransferase (PAPS reductase)/FAD synthetase
MRTIVTFSGGKDSLAALLWIRNNFTKKFTTVFCDTGWENPVTYRYIDEVAEKLKLNLIKLKSRKFNGMVDLAMKKKRFPSSQPSFLA